MKKIGFLVFGIIGIIVIIGLNPVLAADSPGEDQTPNISRWIDTTYRIDFINMTTINLNATFAVHEIEYFGLNVTADFIRNNYGTLGQRIINKIREEINNAFNSTINTMFANDTVKCENTTLDESTVIGVASGGDEYQPPINFTKNATITFNVTSFGFEENTQLNLDDVIMGTLKINATISKTFELSAEPGYANTFIFKVPGDINITRVDDKGEINSNRTATWYVNNLNGTNATPPLRIEANLTIKHRDPRDPNIYTENKTNAFVTVDFYKIDIVALRCDTNLNFSAKLYCMRLPSEFSIPRNIRIDYINSDWIRLALANNIIERTSIDNFTENMTGKLEERLSSVFGENITIEINKAALNESLEQSYNISNMNTEVPVNFYASTHIELRLSTLIGNLTKKQQGGETSAALTLFTIPLRFNLTAIKSWDTTYKLILPPELKIASVEDSLGRAIKYTENGRDVFEVSVSGDESDEVTITIDLTPLLLLFIVPGIVLFFMMFLCSLIIKIMDWRENKFIKKNF